MDNTPQDLEAFGFISFRADASGRWTSLSGAWEALTGASVEASLGEFLMERIHPEDWVSVQPEWAMLLRGERATLEQLVRFTHPQRGHVEVELLARVVSTESGEEELVGLLKPRKDVRAPESMEQELERQLARLVGGIAHDFNNMLQGIATANELLKSNLDEGDPDYECCEIIDTCSERLSDVVSQLVSFARVGHHNPTRIDLPALVRSAIAQVKREHGGRRFETALDPRALFIEADHAQMLRALVLLLENSLAATGDFGRIVVASSLIKSDQSARDLDRARPQTSLRITIEDDGAGFTEQALEHALEPFFTTKLSRRGMGLSVAHGIIRQHDGLLDIENPPTGGARVIIDLPHPEHLENSIENDATIELNAWVPTRATILIVDDEPDILKLMSRTLTESGFDVLKASNGEDALEIYARHQHAITLCVMDYIMPGLSGDELIDAFRHINPEINLLICTGYDLRATHQTPRRENILFKPYTSGQLVAMIHKHRAKS